MCIVSTVWDSLLTLLYCFSPQSRTQVTLPLTLAGSSRLDETRHHVLCSQGSMMGGPPCNGDGTTMAEE